MARDSEKSKGKKGIVKLGSKEKRMLINYMTEEEKERLRR